MTPNVALAALLLLRTKRRRRPRKKVPPPKAPRAAGVAYAVALRDLMDEWRVYVRAELADGGLRLDAPVRLPDLRGRVLGLRTQIANFFTAERAGDIALRAGATVARFTQRELSRVIGVPLGDALPATTLDRFRQENVAKIEGLAVSELDRLAGVLERAGATGLRVEDLAEDIEHEFSVTESYATLLARDQTLKLNGQISERRQVEAGVVRYRWVSSRDERVREEHAALDGTEQSWAVAPVVDQATGRRAHPGQDFQCRCTAAPVLEDVFGADL